MPSLSRRPAGSASRGEGRRSLSDAVDTTRGKAFGGGQMEPLGTAQACPGLRQAPHNLLGSGDPAGGEDSLGAEPRGWKGALSVFPPCTWVPGSGLRDPFPTTLGQVIPAAGQGRGSDAVLGGHLLEVSKLLEEGNSSWGRFHCPGKNALEIILKHILKPGIKTSSQGGG